jgi:hypothetical protein
MRNVRAARGGDIRSMKSAIGFCAADHALRAHARAATVVVIPMTFPLSSPQDDVTIIFVRTLNRFAGQRPTCQHAWRRPSLPLFRKEGFMPRRQSKSAPPADWPWTLRWVIEAAEQECPHGHASALRELTALALHKVPSRGIFDPAVRGEEDLFAAIESVAKAHLELVEARVSWRHALEAGGVNLEQRDALEEAALQVQSVSDTAYFYAGLAFGLAFVYVHRSA